MKATNEQLRDQLRAARESLWAVIVEIGEVEARIPSDEPQQKPQRNAVKSKRKRKA